MSAADDALHPSCSQRALAPLQTPLPPPDDSQRIVFTRQLWQRTMPDGKQGEHVALDKSQSTTTARSSHADNTASIRRNSSLLSRRRSPSPSTGSKSPTTPEESPSFRFTAKRSVGIVGPEDKAIASTDTSPAHTRNNSNESTVPVCICQPEPKPPRPRNAFILYRQHHQSSVVARNPGLANPEISKIIGEQWQNECNEQKNKWKALAEEEKIRHQQQYPNYRYQPKRSGRNNSNETNSSTEKPKCQKCGGRTILPTTGPPSVPPTPEAATTPLTRALPAFRDMAIASPAVQRAGSRSYHIAHPGGQEELDDIGPVSPDAKRRRFNSDHPMSARPMHPQYNGQIAAGSIAPGTPIPFVRAGPPIQPFVPAGTQLRRESLPGIKGMVSPPGPMQPPPPPPRPGMGYQQHRLSQGHIVHDRSLILPPLHAARSMSAAAPGSGKSLDQQLADIQFSYKIKILSQVAPPAPKTLRGPLIAVEGDNHIVALNLANWLNATLAKDDDLAVTFVPGPKVVAGETPKESMANYHTLASEWLIKDKDIQASLALRAPEEKQADDTKMTDATPKPAISSSPSRKIEENYSSSEHSPSPSDNSSKGKEPSLSNTLAPSRTNSTDKMDLDTTTTNLKPSRSPSTTVPSLKPITIIPNYSLHTCNTYAHLVSVAPGEGYAACEHWQWTATLWRGTTGPDLTIYVVDVPPNTPVGPSVEIEHVEGRADVGIFVVKRGKEDEVQDGEVGVESSVLRRVGFEVSEWVRAFGVDGGRVGRE